MSTSSNAAMARFADSQPILNMLQLLSQSGRKHFTETSVWEVCLCSLILGLEPKCSLQKLLEALPYDPDHTRMLDEIDVLNTLAHLGYICRPAPAELEDIDERLLPGLFIPSAGDPCIVLGRDAEGVLHFYDPLSKLISTVPPSVDGEGRIWFFQRYDESRQPTSAFMRKGSGHSWFRALLGRFSGTFAQVMTAGLILNLIALATPLFIMLVYDRVIAAGALDTLPMLVIGAFVAIGFEWRMRHIRTTGLSWLAGRLDNIVGNKIFAHLIGLSPTLIESASISAQIARIKTFEAVRDFFSGSVFLSLLEAPFIILSLAFIMWIAGPLVWVPVAGIAAYIVLFMLVRHKVKTSIRLAAKATSMRQQFTIDTFDKLEAIRVSGLSDKWQEKFRHLSGKEMMGHFYLNWLGMVAETFAHMLTVLTAVATIGFGVHMVWAGTITTGALVAMMILVWRVLTPFYSLCTMLPRLEQLRNSIAQVNNLMEIETEAEIARSYSKLSRIQGSIQFDNVSFQYNKKSDLVFSGLSFDAKAGDFVVITGGNSTGKTTVLHLIQSLYNPVNGAVRIDGFDIRQLDAPDLRRQIAYIPKTPHFFSGSIIDNIRISNPTASRNEIYAALELADAMQDIEALPQGLDTIIGPNGNGQLTDELQTQLSLVRAYLHPSSIMLIDELPNTLLFGNAGKNFKDYLARMKGKRTIIFCTYRQDIMKLADTIVWLRGSEAPLCGDRDTVLNRLELVQEKAA